MLPLLATTRLINRLVAVVPRRRWKLIFLLARLISVCGGDGVFLGTAFSGLIEIERQTHVQHMSNSCLFFRLICNKTANPWNERSGWIVILIEYGSVSLLKTQFSKFCGLSSKALIFSYQVFYSESFFSILRSLMRATSCILIH